MQYKLTISVFLMSYYISIILGAEMCIGLQFDSVLILCHKLGYNTFISLSLMSFSKILLIFNLL